MTKWWLRQLNSQHPKYTCRSAHYYNGSLHLKGSDLNFTVKRQWIQTYLTSTGKKGRGMRKTATDKQWNKSHHFLRCHDIIATHSKPVVIVLSGHPTSRTFFVLCSIIVSFISLRVESLKAEIALKCITVIKTWYVEVEYPKAPIEGTRP